MIGIVSYGVYVPRLRLLRKDVASAMGWLGQTAALAGEKAVANYDEDALTMSVAAGMNSIQSTERDRIGGLFLATTTAPYRERENAAIVATAMNLHPDIRTADFANSLKAGSAALLSACEAVKAGGLESAVVCASDCRLGRPGGPMEMASGDAAAALLVGKDDVVATFEGDYSLSYDFPDHWRSQFDRYDRFLEDRLVRDVGYGKFITEAVEGLLKKYSLEAKDLAKVIYPCLYPRDFAAIGKAVGLEQRQIQGSLVEAVGETGTTFPLLGIAAALEEARPRDNIVVVGYGSGSQALWFKATPQIENKRTRSLQSYLSSKAPVSYEKYLAFRGILPVEIGMRGEVARTALPVAWREREFVLGLVGSKCKKCGTPQLPPQRVCVNPDCGAVDQMEPYPFANRNGGFFTYTEDRLAACPDPPQMFGMVDFDGGGRYIFDITDADPGTIKVGGPARVTFRRKYLDEPRGIHGYFWKAMPPRFP